MLTVSGSPAASETNLSRHEGRGQRGWKTQELEEHKSEEGVRRTQTLPGPPWSVLSSLSNFFMVATRPSPQTHCAPECHRPCSRADPSACKTTPFPSLINSNPYFRPQVNVTSPLNSKTRLCPVEYLLCSIYNRWESFIYVIGGGWRSGGVMSVPVKY